MSDSKDSKRNVCITSVDGHTGHLIAELLMTGVDFKDKVDSVTGLTLHPNAARSKELKEMGVKIVKHVPGREREVVKALKDIGADTICLIPPTDKDKFDITFEAINAAKKANVPNVLFISSAGCDYADPQKQPRLHEFLELEALCLSAKGDPNTDLGHSPCVIRAGFYAENLLIYAHQAQKEGLLPLPIGENHLFAPVALGDVAQLAAHVLSGKGQDGFDDRHRGQLMVCTGPMLCSGKELAQSASQALGVQMEFENVSEAEAKRILHTQGHHDESEREYLLEYYSLVREGKTNYISTTAFVNVTGNHPQEPDEFFKVYAESFLPEKAKNGTPKGKKRGAEEEDSKPAKKSK